MSRGIRGTGECKAEFDSRMATIQKLQAECIGEEGPIPADAWVNPRDREAELRSEVTKLCNWINDDPRVRRNLDGNRYGEVLKFRDRLPEHGVWAKVEMMLTVRKAQNSAERKRQVREQRESAVLIIIDSESEG